MTDAAINILFQYLNDLLIQETSLLSGVRDEIEDIKRELESMRASLNDAESWRDSNEGAKAWVRQVREAALDVEDVIDGYLYQIEMPKGRGFVDFLLDTGCLPRNIFHRHRLATTLQRLKGQIKEISARRERYALSNTEGSQLYNANQSWEHHGETCLFMDEDEIVGLKERIEGLIGWLTEEESKRTVISVVGMGGLGKTTLVAQVLRNLMIKKHFECRVWISVSQRYMVEELLKGMIKDLFQANELEVPSDLDSRNRRQLLQMANDYLSSKRYVAVLDDIWSVDAWEDLSIAFPRNRCGSKIILTTRHENVASALGEGSYKYCIGPLQQKEAWELFSQKAFWREPCPLELHQQAQKIVARCEGLPLAIVALGRLLSLKPKTTREWDLFYRNLRWESTNDQILERMKRVLLLSIYDLPYYLKYCFFYCCIFPEAHAISRKQLIRLWVAEGFIEDKGIITMEEEAECYLRELLYRNLLQVIRLNGFGRVKKFRVHDLMREVALSLADEEKFCFIYDGRNTPTDDRFRRMSIYNPGETLKKYASMPHLRSLLVFEVGESSASFLNQMASSFRLLRVLNLAGAPIDKVPDEVTELFNLQYLNISRTKVEKLPGSIGRLRNLQTLDVRDTRMRRVPDGTVKLQKLRHLFCYKYDRQNTKSFDCFSGIEVPTGICNIKTLQSLADMEEKDGEVVKQVGNLTELRRFGIFNVKEIHGADLCLSIGKMKHLLTFGVKAVSNEEVLQLDTLSPHPPLLEKLYLRGRLERVPQWFRSLTNLKYLLLHWSQLREDPIPLLQALPNLVDLRLTKAYQGKQLWFRNGWFSRLKKLLLWDFTQLNQIIVEKDAMPSIKKLHLVRCGELKMVPQGLEHLISLEELYLEEMPVELSEKLKLEDREEHNKFRHIPSIQHRFWQEGKGWVVDQLT